MRASAWSGVQPWGNARRASNVADSGADEAQSPARIVPMFRAYGTGAGMGLVDLPLERPQRLDQPERGLDRVVAAARVGCVAALGLDGDLEPADPGAAEQQLEPGALGKQHGVGQHARAGGGEGAVAGALLLDDADHRERAGERVGVGLEQRLDGQRDHREARLHVAGAAAVHPAVRDDGLERRRRPALRVARRDDVDVAVQEQRATLARAVSRRPAAGRRRTAAARPRRRPRRSSRAPRARAPRSPAARARHPGRAAPRPRDRRCWARPRGVRGRRRPGVPGARWPRRPRAPSPFGRKIAPFAR